MRNRTFALMLSATTAISVLTIVDAAQAQRLARTNSYEDLTRRAQNMLEDVRALKCFRNDSEATAYYNELHALDDAVSDLEKSTYPKQKHEPLDWHIERLDSITQKIRANLYSIPRPCPPPDPSTGVLHGPDWDQPGGGSETPPPQTPKADTAPEHSSATTPDGGGMLATNALAHNAWTLLGDYANFSPSAGSNADQWGGGMRGQVIFGEGLAADFGGGYHNVSGGGANLDNWTADASLVWYFANGRVGPTVGYQNNSESGFHSDTWNYGGFGEYFTLHYTFGAKAGGFSTNGSFSNSNGYYLGGSVTGYICPNFSVLGGVDYTHFSPFGGSGETDWTVRGTWRPWDATPVAFWGGYTYTSFSPGSFNVSTISVGVIFDLGDGPTLIDSDRGGAVINQASFGPLSLKF